MLQVQIKNEEEKLTEEKRKSQKEIRNCLLSQPKTQAEKAEKAKKANKVDKADKEGEEDKDTFIENFGVDERKQRAESKEKLREQYRENVAAHILKLQVENEEKREKLYFRCKNYSK